MKKPVGVICFLGTNCDRDVGEGLKSASRSFKYLWYKDRFQVRDFSSFILPGGFSYGDYLRSGALAARTPIMDSLKEAAKKGFPLLGICNGFQILCEAGLLQGTFMRNKNLKHIDQWVDLKLESPSSFWVQDKLKKCSLPISHHEGCYYANEESLKALQDNKQIWWTYEKNPNGSLHSIAGIMNKMGNVVGLMPHPERALYEWMGGDHGKAFFKENF